MLNFLKELYRAFKQARAHRAYNSINDWLGQDYYRYIEEFASPDTPTAIPKVMAMLKSRGAKKNEDFKQIDGFLLSPCGFTPIRCVHMKRKFVNPEEDFTTAFLSELTKASE